MALKGTYEAVKQAIQDVTAPELQELKGGIAALKSEIAGLRGEMRQLEKRMEEGFAHLNQLIDMTNKRIDALKIRERLAAVEAKLATRTN